MDGDTCGVNLGEGEVGQVSTLAEGLDCGGTVATHGVGRQEEGAAITTGGENHGVGGVTLKLACDEVAHDDTTGAAVNHHDVKHLATVVALDGALLDLTVQRGVCAEQKLLAGLTLGVECTGNLCATE